MATPPSRRSAPVPVPTVWLPVVVVGLLGAGLAVIGPAAADAPRQPPDQAPGERLPGAPLPGDLPAGGPAVGDPPAGDPPVGGPPAGGPPAGPIADGLLSGEWVGRYQCPGAQGETGMRLVLRRDRDGRLAGVFHFFAVPTNPTVPEGCYRISGTVRGDPPVVTLSGGSWLRRPYRYQTIDLVGTVDPAARTLSGRIVPHPGCTRFAASKRSPSLDLPAACRPPAISRRPDGASDPAPAGQAARLSPPPSVRRHRAVRHPAAPAGLAARPGLGASD